MKTRTRRYVAGLLLGVMSIILGAGILHILHHNLVSPIEHYCGTDEGQPCRTSEDDGCIYLDIIPPPAVLTTGTISLVCLVALAGVLYIPRGTRYLLVRLVDRCSLSDPPSLSDHTIGLSPAKVWRTSLQGI